MKVFVPMEKAGPRVYADARADSYEIYRAEGGAPIHMCCAEGRGCRLCIVQAFGLGELVGAITGGDQLLLEEIPELFWCCGALMIILTGCHPMSFISAMLGVKKN